MATEGRKKSVAIIGSGVSGMTAAWAITHAGETVTVYEKNSRIGGHTNTVTTTDPITKTSFSVDTGFIVFNPLNYPNLLKIFEMTGTPWMDSDMSFAVSVNHGQIEYAGSSLSTFFAQIKNVFSLTYWRFLFDILRFNRNAPAMLALPFDPSVTLESYVNREGYSREFLRHYLLPMIASIWSAPLQTVMSFPVQTLIRFFHNHCLMQVDGRPQWRTVKGGSKEYVSRLTASFADKIKLNAAVKSITRENNKVQIFDSTGASAEYDAVVFACHADEALAILNASSAATSKEKDILSGFEFQRNIAYLHSDVSLMPRLRSVWSSWNYLAWDDGSDGKENLCLTYWMNNLQPYLPTKPDILVTLNPPPGLPSEALTMKVETYTHPIFTPAAIRSQLRMKELQGELNTYFCGAWMKYGFHEDGALSGLNVAEKIVGSHRLPFQPMQPPDKELPIAASKPSSSTSSSYGKVLAVVLIVLALAWFRRSK
jgi:uncharacterized protein